MPPASPWGLDVAGFRRVAAGPPGRVGAIVLINIELMGWANVARRLDATQYEPQSKPG